MDYKRITETINELQRREQNELRFEYSISEEGNERTNLGRHALDGSNTAGLYWIWTDYTIDQLRDCELESVTSNRIEINLLAEQRKEIFNGLSSIDNAKRIRRINGEDREFKVVYNGIGSGLRKRILDEIKISPLDNGTGSLDIRHTSLREPSHWLISYVNFNSPEFQDLLPEINYARHARLFEIVWRIENTWPILCKE